MERKEKDGIRSKHRTWVAYRVARMALEGIPELDGLRWTPGKTRDMFVKIGYIINQGMENHHDWNRPGEIYDFLSKEEHVKLYHSK